MSTTPDLTLARQVLASQPFSTLFRALGQGSAILGLDIWDEGWRQQHDVVHGIVLSYAADQAATSHDRGRRTQIIGGRDRACRPV